MYKNIKDRKIRLGLVGCGRISGKHLEAIEKHSDNLELILLVPKLQLGNA
jgi:UDP-N-acetyl-2-amino-2-deoxyglucuronate dehydrogenase